MTSLNHAKTPKQYKQGYTEFYKLRFKVTPDVLIPRPETELLVDEVLKFAKLYGPLDILDLGTGAGNIAIALAKNLVGSPKHSIVATDISEKALKIAQHNARLHNVGEILFLISNLLENLPKNLNFNVIVTNLPYIPSERIPYLDSSVKDFEPLVALDGGADGFDLYRKLFAQIAKLGWKPKLIVSEIDYTHGELALTEAQKYFPQAKVEVKTDLAYKQRMLIIEL